MKRNVIFIACWALALAIAGGGAAFAEEPAREKEPAWKKDFYTSYPRVPDEKWRTFLSELGKSPAFTMVQAMRIENVKPLVEKLENELDVKIRTIVLNALDFEIGNARWNSLSTSSPVPRMKSTEIPNSSGSTGSALPSAPVISRICCWD